MTTERFSRINLWAMAIVVTILAGEQFAAEPTVVESREGGTSLIRIASMGQEQVYRIDLASNHVPASEQDEVLRQWESYRLGAFVCFNTNQFTGEEFCKTRDPKVYSPPQLDVAGWVAAFKAAGMKYAVLTTRHTSGFLLWDSAFDYNLVSQSRAAGYDYDPLGPSCWFTYGTGKNFQPSHPFPAEAIAKQIQLGWKRGAANALLATAPDHTGKMRPEDVEQLRRLGSILRGEEP